MIKILVYDTGNFDGVSWWRNVLPLSVLRLQYADRVNFHYSDRPTVSDLFQADAVLMFRPSSDNALKVAEAVKRIGRQKPLKLIVDIDDDLWSLPAYHFAASGYRKHTDRMRKIYDMADVVWCSTEQLRYVIGDLGRAAYIPNSVLPTALPEEPAPYQGIACWRGSTAQFSDIGSAVARKWYDAWKGQYNKWLFWGYMPNLDHDGNAKVIDYDEPLDFFENLPRLGASVFWKPLEKNKFNDAKSNIAWIEATIAGGVCVTNYAGSEGWEWALPEFTTDPEYIAQVWETSRDAIMKDYNLLETNKKRFESIVKTIGG